MTYLLEVGLINNKNVNEFFTNNEFFEEKN